MSAVHVDTGKIAELLVAVASFITGLRSIFGKKKGG